MKRNEILIDETLEEVVFKVKRITPPKYDDQCEMLLETGLIDSIEGFTHDYINTDDLTLDDILKEACRYINISPDRIKNEKNSRKRELVKVRYYYSLTALDIFKDCEGYTLEKIGSLISRDHAVVLHYKKTFNGKIELDEKHRLKTAHKDKEALKCIKNSLNGKLENFNKKQEGVQI